nr:hypothetical protein [uncultured Clostridium sp.]
MKHTRNDLKIMQGWSLERKIQVTQTRILEWYLRNNGKVFISFSGGKDSTVLLDLARGYRPTFPPFLWIPDWNTPNCALSYKRKKMLLGCGQNTHFIKLLRNMDTL